jgi:uncharacterized membrane protein
MWFARGCLSVMCDALLELSKVLYLYSVIVCIMLLTVFFDVLVVAALSALVGAGVLLCADRPS